MSNPLQQLDEALRSVHPLIHSDLQSGIQTRIGTPRDLCTWFSWRNGQSHDTTHELFDTYSFVSYEVATLELYEMRSTMWKSPLNFMVLMAFSRRSFYSIPLLTDCAGDGYCYNTISRRPYYRFKDERDILLPSFHAFIEFLTQYVSQPTPDAANSLEEEFLQNYG